jgi:hypothetical protein
MPNPLGFDALKGILHRRIAQLPDQRHQGPNTRDAIQQGKQSLSAFLLSRNLLACLVHTVREWSDAQYALLRRVLARRQTFFHDIQTLMQYMVFESWEPLMDFMIRGLELESQVDTS